MKLSDQIEIAARDLPQGYIINIGIEAGAAWVSLTTPKGTDVSIDDGGYGLSLGVKMALFMALAEQEEPIDERL